MRSPKVCVLLATYNGSKYLKEQVFSIHGQEGVVADIVASDDQSNDGTLEKLAAYAEECRITILPTQPEKFGSAIRNFLRLIKDSPPADYDYFSFSDQDDIWLATKLQRATQQIERLSVDVYSSDALAFWPDGETRYLRKSQPQVKYDHLIESAGPGCTFVFSRKVYIHLHEWVSSNYVALQDIRVHDWLIYAWARTQGYKWHIDPVSLIHYRQHASNELGANVGLRAIVARLNRLFDGSYRRETLAIGAIVGARSPFLDALSRMRISDRLWLTSIAFQTRRRLRDRAVSTLFYLFSK